MTDLTTFLSRHPQIKPEVLQKIQLFRAEAALAVLQTTQRVQTRKRSPDTGADLGVRITNRADYEIEKAVIDCCSELYGIVALSGINADDLTALFEELAGAIIMESRRLYRNATAGMYFERGPSLEQLRLHKELADKTPIDEIADYIDPEPVSWRIDDALIQCIEPQRLGVTAAAMQIRVEHMQRLAPIEPNGDGKPAGVKGIRTRKTPHENPELLLKGKTQVTKETAGDVLGLSDRQIRNLIEEGELTEQGEGHGKMIMVNSLRARIKGKIKTE